MILSYRSLTNISERMPYQPKKAAKCVILAKRCTNTSIAQDSKLELFKLLSKILIKNIENFYFISRNYRDVFHTREDLIGEAYIVFESCLKNFDFRKGKLFYFYYNKALTRAFLRIIERSYSKHENTMRIKDGHESLILHGSASRISLDFTDFYFDQFRLSDRARRVVVSKMNKEKIQDFLDKNKDMNYTTYFNALNEAKSKLTGLR